MIENVDIRAKDEAILGGLVNVSKTIKRFGAASVFSELLLSIALNYDTILRN